MAGGNAINRPLPSLRRNRSRFTRVRKSQKKKEASRGEKRATVDEMIPIQIRKKRRTNPHANITLSGKKKRLLMKEIKRSKKEQAAMEVMPAQVEDKVEQQESIKRKKQEAMDTS